MPSKTEDGLQPAHQPLGWKPAQIGQKSVQEGDIVNLLWKLKSEGRSDHTVRNIGKCLRVLEKNTNIESPDSVKQFIASLERNEGYKRNLTNAYCHYANYNGLSWVKPIYRESAKLPRIPTEEKLNMIISASPQNLALKLLISKETGMRPIELTRLKVKDIDLDNGNLYPETVKHGSPRVLKLNPRTVSLLRGYVAKYELDINESVFGGTSEAYAKAFRRIRNRLSKKLNDPNIKGIKLYHFRHFYATMLYHKTKDILHVQQKMGHRRLTTTLVYTQLVENGADEFTVKVAKTVEEASQLIESGFEFVCDIEGAKIFRKRK